MIKNEKILITGGTGSLGKELAKKLCLMNKVVIYSRNEERQFEMQQLVKSTNIEYFIGDVRDGSTLIRALNSCTLAIHAAAMKDIIMCESQPVQAYLNNLEGSRCFLECVSKSSVSKALGVSTDKAVNPTNVYGATKYIMERMFYEENKFSSTQLFCIRFGNMIDSKGSLISTWKNHPNKKEIKLTHSDMSRFFFTTKEAAESVIHCLENGEKRKIYIPKMKIARIKNILKVITGFDEFDIVGLFPGEKLYESLFSEGEQTHCFDEGNYYVIDFDRTNSNPPKILQSDRGIEWSEIEIKQAIYNSEDYLEER